MVEWHINIEIKGKAAHFILTGYSGESRVGFNATLDSLKYIANNIDIIESKLGEE